MGIDKVPVKQAPAPVRRNNACFITTGSVRTGGSTPAGITDESDAATSIHPLFSGAFIPSNTLAVGSAVNGSVINGFCAAIHNGHTIKMVARICFIDDQSYP